MSKFLRPFLLVLSLLCSAGASAAVIDVSHTWNGTEISAAERLFRDGAPSQADTPKSFPGTFADSPTYFKTWSFDVVAGSLATITMGANNSLNGFFSVYDTSLDTGNLASNYLADAGSSGPSFSFSLYAPTSGKLLLVLNSVFGNESIGQLAHATIDLDLAPSDVPEPASLGLLAIGALGVALARRRIRS